VTRERREGVPDALVNMSEEVMAASSALVSELGAAAGGRHDLRHAAVSIAAAVGLT
jgi:hypothetical protein